MSLLIPALDKMTSDVIGPYLDPSSVDTYAHLIIKNSVYGLALLVFLAQKVHQKATVK